MFPVHHPAAGAHRVTGAPPVKLSETPGGVGAAAPLLGQHTSETLFELLGLDAATLAQLAARGIVFETVISETDDIARPSE